MAHSMPAKSWSPSLSQRMLAILAASVVAVSAPAALVFYFFTRDAAISEAEQFAASSADRRILGLEYTLRLAGTSLYRFDLMLRDSVAAPTIDGEVTKFAAGLERNPAGMLVTRRDGFDGRFQAGVLFHPSAARTDEVYRFHARAQRLMTIYAGAVVPPLDSMWLLTRDQTAVIYVPRDPDFIYRATTGNNYLASEWVTLGDPATNPERKLRWTHAAFDPVLRTWIISAVRPFDLNNAWLGTIGHDFFLDELVQHLVGPDQLPGTQHFLVDSAGAPIIAGRWQSALEANQWTGEARRTFDDTIHRLQAAFEGHANDGKAVRLEIDGKPASALMRILPETGWRYFVVTPIASITGNASKALLLFGLTAAAAIALVVAVTHLLVQRQIVGPIRRLADAVRGFAGSKTDVRAKVDRTDDIGDLGQAFNAMADYIASSHRDLTRAHQELQHRNAALVDANRTKSNFLANMSHELRTPLNAIIGFSDMLINEERMRLDGPRRREYAKLINDSGNHLLAVVNSILDMSKLETGDFELSPEPFVPAGVISNCCDLLALKAREQGIELSTKLPESLPEIIADKRSFKQILLNLISNAVKFTERGGRVTVTAAAETSGILVTVADTGVGISAEDMPKIGRPFFQAKGAYDRRHDGTGLGLSIVQGLVTLHGGSFEMSSRVGQGTTVSVRLPWNCETAQPAEQSSNVARPAFDRAQEQAPVPAEVSIKKTA
jgi:signal transduction histidine kinase